MQLTDTLSFCVQLFAQRKGEMSDMVPDVEGATRITFTIATRGLLGLRNALLTATRGLGIMNTLFLGYAPMAGAINMRENGSLIAFETGQVTSYALESTQQRGQLFCRPGRCRSVPIMSNATLHAIYLWCMYDGQLFCRPGRRSSSMYTP